MANENANLSSRELAEDLVSHRLGDARQRNLFDRIRSMVDGGSDKDDIARYVDRLRLDGDPESCRELDQYLIGRICRFEKEKTEIESIHAELRQQLEQFLNPPYFPARFLGAVSTPAGEFAAVSQDGAQRVVAYTDQVNRGDLSAGDEVFLCYQRNAVVAKAQGTNHQIGETAIFVRRTGSHQLILSDRDTEVVVMMSVELAAEKLRAGDRVLWDRAARMALSRLETTDASNDFEDVDAAPPQRLGGLDQLRDSVLARFTFGFLHPDLARDYQVLDDGSRRLLLEGPPGTGKTMLMRTIAATIACETGQRCRVVKVAGAQLYSSYVGETERNIRKCFATLNDYDGPGIVFFDEIDAIGRVRGNVSGFHDDRFLGTLLSELEGMQRSNVAVIAATNRADTLDPALRERFAWEIQMPRPNLAAANEIFSIHMPEGIPYHVNGADVFAARKALIEAGVSRLYEPNADNRVATLQFRDATRRDVAARELVSGRLIEQICKSARASAFERQCRGGDPGVAQVDMEVSVGDAIERLRNTLTKRNVAAYLSNLPQDIDVVSVEPIRPRVDQAKYSR